MTEIDYVEARERRHRALAASATQETARRAHEALADAYAARAARLRSEGLPK